MLKIFACDLDQTLIYSSKFIFNLSLAEKEKIRIIEAKDGIAISYISVDCIAKIQEIMENNIFIPATTRTIEQYKEYRYFKILLFQDMQ